MKFKHYYLNYCKKRLKIEIDNHFISFEEILFGVPQRSILRLLLFNIPRNNSKFASRCINTVDYGSELLSNLGPKLWRILPDEYKLLSPLNQVDSKIKTWVSNSYLCCCL